jgi:hypothetical protein
MQENQDRFTFMIRLYDSEDGQLRGQITHITHNERVESHPLKGLDDLLLFLAPYLRSMGVRLSLRSRILLLLSGHRTKT